MKEFRTFIVSNSCSHLFPENRMTKFSNVLPVQNILDGSYAVALKGVGFDVQVASVDIPENEFAMVYVLSFNFPKGFNNFNNAPGYW